MNGRRLGTLVLAGSLGLNVALGGVLIYQAVSRSRESTRYESERGREYSDRGRRSDWQSRYRAESDSAGTFPRLNGDQIRNLREMRRETEEAIHPMREEINTLQALMREELDRPQPDISRLDSMVVETSRLQNSIQRHYLRLILKEREVLSPEQYRSFTRMMMPGQYRDREPDRYRPRGRSDRDTTQNSRRSPGGSRGSREPPPPPYPYPPDWH